MTWRSGMRAWDPNGDRCTVYEVHATNPRAFRYLGEPEQGPWLTVVWDDGTERVVHSHVMNPVDPNEEKRA